MPAFVKVAEVGELSPGDCKHVELDSDEIALFNVEGEYYALHGICPHQGGPLGDGYTDGEVVSCPWHGWQFNVKSGQSPMIPGISVQSYPVRIEGGEIQVEV
ncbi:MAG: non-heme iron oxygenase ferredoxin subunit [Armatimonadetes bacterium]|nr:non-heme iron oxygenase ferredoxin subunit [Armatimonadota bacterium]